VREREQAGSMLQWRRLPLLLYGIVLVSAGLAIHLAGTAIPQPVVAAGETITLDLP